jgi:hypothetical protein
VPGLPHDSITAPFARMQRKAGHKAISRRQTFQTRTGAPSTLISIDNGGQKKR